MKRSPIIARKDGRRGFSLIESLVGLAIFSIAIVSIIQGISMGLTTWRDAEMETQALELAQNVMEEVIYNAIYEPGVTSGQYEPPQDRFGWETTIEEMEVGNLFTVTVRVTWVMANGSEGDVTLTTMRAIRDKALMQYEGQPADGSTPQAAAPPAAAPAQ